MQFVEFLNVIYNHGRTDIKGKELRMCLGVSAKLRRKEFNFKRCFVGARL